VPWADPTAGLWDWGARLVPVPQSRLSNKTVIGDCESNQGNQSERTQKTDINWEARKTKKGYKK